MVDSPSRTGYVSRFIYPRDNNRNNFNEGTMIATPVKKSLLVGSLPKAAPASQPFIRWFLVTTTVGFLTLFIVVPVANVFTQALSNGLDAYVRVFHVADAPEGANLSIPEKRKLASEKSQADKTWRSIRLTVEIAAVVLPLNIVFGIAAAWAVTKFRFKGRTVLVALIDLPFSVSPVIAGLIFVLLLGRSGLLGVWATNWTWPDPVSLHWQGFAESWWPLSFTREFTGVIFTPMAIALASIFVTFPFVARSLIPLMETQGSDEELAALSLGATGWRTFRTVTLPNIKWALLYGVILCTARVFGEFGAVSVVSGHTDSNDTMPLRIEKLWNEYNNQAAFAVASVLAFLAVLTLIVKTLVELKTNSEPTTKGE
jgi:sulfate transport system permease protein